MSGVRRLHGYVPVAFLDGTWHYVHALVNPRPVAEDRGAKCYRVTVDFVPGMSKFKSRSKRFWGVSILHSRPAVESLDEGKNPKLVLYLPDKENVLDTEPKTYEKRLLQPEHLMRAVEDPDPAGLWWCSARGALERPVTVYEAMRRGDDPPPRVGWTLRDGAEASAALRRERPVESELDVEERVAKLAPLYAEIDAAKAALARHERGLALKKTLVKKWQKKLSRLERRVMEKLETPDVLTRGES